MSQHDFNIANQGFPSFRADLNSGLGALASNSSGATAPSTTFAYQFWYDTANDLLKMRNGDDDAWITLAAFDQANDEWEVRSAVVQAVDSAGLELKTDDGVTRVDIANDGEVTIPQLSAQNLDVTNSATISTASVSNLTATNADFSNLPQVSGDDVALQIDTIEGKKEQIAQGFIQREGTRGDLDVDLAVAIELNLLGFPVAGGFYAGLIDTIAGTIDSQDDYQTGLRYALIVAPKSLEGGRGASPAAGLPTGDLEWDTQRRGGEAGCFTRWNGLEATNVIIAKNDTSYEVHDFIEAVRAQYPAVSTPGGSEWYLPAMDELELLYRNFKPNNADNRDDTRNRNFPGTQVVGTNPSSAIEGFQYENNPRIPDVTYLDAFKEGNAEAIDLDRYWSTTDADEGGLAWNQGFTDSGREGFQAAFRKDNTFPSVRPVRRVVL